MDEEWRIEVVGRRRFSPGVAAWRSTESEGFGEWSRKRRLRWGRVVEAEVRHLESLQVGRIRKIANVMMVPITYGNNHDT